MSNLYSCKYNKSAFNRLCKRFQTCIIEYILRYPTYCDLFRPVRQLRRGVTPTMLFREKVGLLMHELGVSNAALSVRASWMFRSSAGFVRANVCLRASARSWTGLQWVRPRWACSLVCASVCAQSAAVRIVRIKSNLRCHQRVDQRRGFRSEGAAIAQNRAGRRRSKIVHQRAGYTHDCGPCNRCAACAGTADRCAFDFTVSCRKAAIGYWQPPHIRYLYLLFKT